MKLIYQPEGRQCKGCIVTVVWLTSVWLALPIFRGHTTRRINRQGVECWFAISAAGKDGGVEWER